MNMRFVLYVHVALHFTADVDAFDRNGGFDQRTLSDNQRALPVNFTLEISVNAHGTVENQLAGEFGAFA